MRSIFLLSVQTEYGSLPTQPFFPSDRSHLLLALNASLLSQQGIIAVAYFMATIVIVVIMFKETLVGVTNLMTVLVIMDGTEQTFPAISDLVSVFIVMVGIPEQGFPAVSYLMAVFIIMVGAIRQDALATEELFHGRFLSPFIYGGGQVSSCPSPISESLAPFLFVPVIRYVYSIRDSGMIIQEQVRKISALIFPKSK